jgi:hypothetical protein
MFGREWRLMLQLVAFTILIRLMPYLLHVTGVQSMADQEAWYPWNFSPLTALCLFSAAVASHRGLFWVWPALAIGVSDIAMAALMNDFEWLVADGHVFLYGCFGVTMAMGQVLHRRKELAWALPTAIAAETVFFLLSNFGVWWFSDKVIYSFDAQGLLLCYTAALPFFGRSLAGTMVFTTLLWSPWCYGRLEQPQHNASSVPAV